MNKKNENIENLLNLLKRWQSIEDDSIRNTTEILKRTDNPVIRLIMEIIRQDSVTHRKLQQLLIENYISAEIVIEPEELRSLWDMITEHDEAERKTIEIGTYALEQVDSPIVKMLLEYLLYDEKKHDKLLNGLEKFTEDFYPGDKILPYI